MFVDGQPVCVCRWSRCLLCVFADCQSVCCLCLQIVRVLFFVFADGEDVCVCRCSGCLLSVFADGQYVCCLCLQATDQPVCCLCLQMVQMYAVCLFADGQDVCCLFVCRWLGCLLFVFAGN